MTRRILLACLLLLACGLGFTAWFLAGATDPAAPEVAQAMRPEAAATPIAATGEGGALAEVGPLGAAAERTSAGERAAVPHDTETTYDVLVQDEAGRPIAGAEVRRTRVYGVPGNEAQHEDLGEPVLTAADGRCSFSGPGDAAWFHVRAEGFSHGSQSTGELTVVLLPSVRVSGQVLDAETLLPIPGARVRPLTKDCKYCDKRSTTADGLGNYSMAGFASERRVGLYVQAEGYLPETAPFKLQGAAARQMDVTLQRGAEVWLEFFDVDTGAPVEKVHVRGGRKHRSDAQGRMRIADLLPSDESDMHLDAKLIGYATASIVLWSKHLNALQPLRIPMVPLRKLSGTVMDPEGAPIGDASVKAKDVTHPEAEQLWRAARPVVFEQGPRKLRYKVRRSFTKRSNLAGGYTFTRLPPWCEELEFSVTHKVYLETTERRSVASGAGLPGHEWVLTPGRVESGEVRGQLTLNGVPTAGRVRWSGALRGGTGRASKDGLFLLEAVEVGTVHLSAELWDLDLDSPECAGILPGSWTATVLPDQSSTVDIALTTPISIISGHLRYPDGEPVPDGGIGITSQEHCANLDTTPDDSGWWSIEVPSRITSWDVLAFNESDMVLRHGVGPGATSVDMVLQRPGVQRLRVIDSRTSRPITNFELRWQRPGADARLAAYQWLWEPELGLPDPAGWFDIRAPGGILDLAVSTRDPTDQPAFAFGVNMSSGQPLELIVRPGQRVDLKLRKDEEPWPKDVEVFLLAQHERGAILWNEESGELYDGDISTGHSADATRRIKFRGRKASLTGLPPGRYTFVSYPDTIRVHPASVRAGAGTEQVLVRWERR